MSGCVAGADAEDGAEESSTGDVQVPGTTEPPDAQEPDAPEPVPAQCDFGDAVSMCPSCERSELSTTALAAFDTAVDELGRDAVVTASDATVDGGKLRVKYVVASDWYEGVGYVHFASGSAEAITYVVTEAVEAIPAAPVVVPRAEVEAAFASCNAAIVYDPCTMNGGDFIAATLHYEHIEECVDEVVDVRVDVLTGEVLRCETWTETCEDQDG